MLGGLTHVLALAAGLPFIPFFIVFGLSYAITRNRTLSVRRAMDVTTLLLIPAVSILFNDVFASSFGFFAVLLFFLLTFGFIGNAQYRIKGRMNPNRLATAVWRIGFVVLSAFYFIFVLLGITLRLSA